MEVGSLRQPRRLRPLPTEAPRPIGRRTSKPPARRRTERPGRWCGIFEPFQSRWPDPTAVSASSPTAGTATSSTRSSPPASPSAARNGAGACRNGADRTSSRSAARSALRSTRSRTRLRPGQRHPRRPCHSGPPNDRLRISLRVLKSDDVARFRQATAQLASGVTTGRQQRDRSSIGSAAASFIARIRRPDGGTEAEAPAETCTSTCANTSRSPPSASTSRPRARHICVPRRQERRRDTRTDGVHRRCRAALPTRRRGPRRPRFAPVFLDEGFIKSDSEFAGRSVQAWKSSDFSSSSALPWTR